MRYFNYAGLCPTRDLALEEARKVMEEFNSMLFSERGVEFYLAKLADARIRVGRLINARGANDIAFVQNSSTASNIALSSAVQAGDIVVTSDQEHPSVLAPLSILSGKGAKIITVKGTSESAFLADLEAACSSGKVRLVLMSHVSYKDGRVLPVKEIVRIARAHGTIVAIDGAQAAGHIPVDVAELDPDVYFFSGHKWCFGPMGTGAMYVSEAFLRESEPPWFSWAAKSEDARYTAKRLEVGTQNLGAVCGLARACEQVMAEPSTISRLTASRDFVRAALGGQDAVQLIEWEDSHAPGILSFANRPGIAPNDIVDYLYRTYQIAVKPIDYPETPSCIRLSWSPRTQRGELSTLVEKIDECLRALA